MASTGPLRVVVAITSIVVALVAAFYASLLPELPVPSQLSQAVSALSRLRSKAELSTTGVTMAARPPVYFFSHGGVRHNSPAFSRQLLNPALGTSQM